MGNPAGYFSRTPDLAQPEDKLPTAKFLLMAHMAKGGSFGRHPLILDSFYSLKSGFLLIFK